MAIPRRMSPGHRRLAEAEAHAGADGQAAVPQGQRRAGRDFDGEIASAVEEAAALRPQMAAALAGWVDAAAAWAAEFWQRSISEAVQETPDAIIALDEDERRAVKHEAAQLIAEARPHLQRRLIEERPEDWPHVKPQTDPRDEAFRPQGVKGPFAASARSSRLEQTVPEAVAGRLNGVLGDVATVFADHGFALAGFRRGDPYGHKGQWHPGPQHRPEWSEQMIEAMAAYGRLHDSYVQALERRERLAAEKRHSEASALWERA